MEEKSDAALVREALAGNKDAFNTLVLRYQDLAYGLAVAHISDFDLARDVVQDAFVYAYRDLAKLRKPSCFGGWLRGIVRNVSHCALRELIRIREMTSDLTEADATAVAAEAPDESAATHEDRRVVHEALGRLKERNREVVCLFYVDGLSYEDISGFLGVSKATVQGRLQRGRVELRRAMKTINVERILKDSAPDASFAERVVEAIGVYRAKGPGENHIGSAWDKSLWTKRTSLLSAGEDGFRVALAMSHSEYRRVRRESALQIGLRNDCRGKPDLERLMGDANAKVRRIARRAFADIVIAPSLAADYGANVAKLIAGIGDTNFKNRWLLVKILARSAWSERADVIAVLERVLDDPKHKVRHEAARSLNRTCPGCGSAPSGK